MKRKIPPLNALKAFEAAARHKSFKKAAEELSVTPAAISKQVKILEDYFGSDLFERNSNNVTLIENAVEYYSKIYESLNILHAATEEFNSKNSDSEISISGYRTFLMQWLLPKLPEFTKENKNLKIKLEPIEFGKKTPSNSDLEIRYGGPFWPGMRAELLFKDEMVVACSPEYLKNEGMHSNSVRAEDILKMKILSLKSRKNDWPEWFKLNALEIKNSKQKIDYFEDLAVILEYIKQSLGVALIQKMYIDSEVSKSNLIIISEKKLMRDFGYYALLRPSNTTSTKCLKFIEWLKQYRSAAN